MGRGWEELFKGGGGIVAKEAKANNVRRGEMRVRNERLGEWEKIEENGIRETRRNEGSAD